LVNLLENWEDIEKHAEYLEHWKKKGSYQIRKSTQGVEIKVSIGEYGYIKTFRESEDTEFIKILAFCKANGFFKVQGTVADDTFYV